MESTLEAVIEIGETRDLVSGPIGSSHDAVPVDLRGRVIDTDFSISCWFQVPSDVREATGDLIGSFDQASRTGWSLATASSAGGYNARGDQISLAFGVDAGTDPAWSACGRPNPGSNYVSNSLTTFDGDLYAATTDAIDARDWAHVYRYQGGSDWEDLGQVGDGAARGVGPMIAHRGALFAATWNYDWTSVEQGDHRPCRVYRLDDRRWEDCGQPGTSRRLFGLASFAGDLYVVGDDFGCYVYRGDTHWEPVGQFPTYGHPMMVHDQRLCVGFLDPAEVMTFRDGSWQTLGNPVLDAPSTQVHALHVHRGRLHATSWPEGRIARWEDPAGWRDLGRPGVSTEVNALATYNGMLYSGSIPWAEVHRFDGPGWTAIRRFYDPVGWEPIAVDDVALSQDGDRRMREWARVTSLTAHDGRLFASTGSSTSAAEDTRDDRLGAVHAMRAGANVWSRPLVPGWHHIMAVHRGSVITLSVDGKEVGDATDAPTSIGSEAPVVVARTDSLRGIRIFDRALTATEVQALADLA